MAYGPDGVVAFMKAQADRMENQIDLQVETELEKCNFENGNVQFSVIFTDKDVMEGVSKDVIKLLDTRYRAAGWDYLSLVKDPEQSEHYARYACMLSKEIKD